MPDSARPLPFGLCITCNTHGTCMYLARRTRPIFRCEEFDDSGDAVVARPLPQETRAAPVAHQLGICSNCDNLVGCMLPRAPAGVWHCEEHI